MTRCAKSQKRVIPEELQTCQFTGQKVLPEFLETCAFSGQRGLRDRLLQSDVSGLYVVPKLAVRSVLSRKVCGPGEAAYCTWLEGPILPSEAGICALTGLPFAQKLLNSRGEFGLLRQLLDGSTTGAESPGLVSWLQGQVPKAFGNLKRIVGIYSPSGGAQALCGELRSLLGFKLRYAGLIVRVRDDQRIIGRYCLGRRAGADWILEAQG
jgi:hypothetical protein